MRKRIHLTEGQLRRLVEQSINEISTETKMSAAQKAARQARDYSDEFLDKSTPRLKRQYAKDMAKRRERQKDTFIKGVNSDAEKTFGVNKAQYFPGLYHSPYRGSMLVDEPVDYGCTDTKPLYKRAMTSDREGWEDYLRGNSYYENGEWKRPYYSRDYDIAKSEPWSEIRRRSNESIARRVTESVMRKLRGGLSEGLQKNWASEWDDSKEQYVAQLDNQDEVEVADIEQELGEIIADLAVNEDPMGMFGKSVPVGWFTLILQFSDGQRVRLNTNFWYTEEDGDPVINHVGVEVRKGNRQTEIGEWATAFRDFGCMKRIMGIANSIIASGSIKNW